MAEPVESLAPAGWAEVLRVDDLREDPVLLFVVVDQPADAFQPSNIEQIHE